jgi:hypothetical protein
MDYIMITKGYIVSYDPIRRVKLNRVEFLFNPNSVEVNFNPNYSFNVAAVGARALAQYGNSAPVEISFKLFLRDTDITANLNELRSLVEKGLDVDTISSAPPMAKIYFGHSFDWLDRVPIGVITEMEVEITRHKRDMTPIEATVEITFTESRINTLGANV